MKSSVGMLRQVIASLIITLSVFMAGTFFGWPSPVTQMMKHSITPSINMTTSQISWMVSAIEVGNLIFPLPVGYLMDTFGRRLCLMASGPLAIAGWALVVFTKDVRFVYVARILHGCAMAIAFVISPVYVGEIAGNKIRGSLCVFFQAMNIMGLLLVYIVGWCVSYNALALSMSVVPVLLIVSLLFIPESPYYLVMTGDKRGAAQSLSWLRATDVAGVEEELRGMSSSESNMSGSAKDMLKRSGKPLAIVLAVGTSQIFSGITVIEAYASTAFGNNPDFPITADACAVMLGLVAILGIALSVTVVDRFGRRPVLLLSCTGLTLSNLVSAYGLYDGHMEWLVLFALGATMFCGNAGLMPLASTIVCEYFPTTDRARANGIVQFVITTASMLALKSYQPVCDMYGSHANFLMFASNAAFSAIVVYMFVPETKGKSFEEIEMLFKTEKPNMAGNSAAKV